MKKIEIESWALRILDQIKNKSPLEDSFVELKAEWPDSKKAARRIAGHANAAHGDNILWLIGVDEEKGIIGANAQELSTWYPQVQSCFDGIAPDLEPLNVTFDNKTISALCFDTSRAPFVVKNPSHGMTGGGPVEWEVPWREATKVRSATRNDLINLLLPQARMPLVEILGANVEMGTEPKPHLVFSLTIYVIPKTPVQLIFPVHKCEALISYKEEQFIAEEILLNTPSRIERMKFEDEQRMVALMYKTPMVPWDASPSLIDLTPDELIIRGAGKILVQGRFTITAIAGWSVGVKLSVTLNEATSGIRIPFTLNMTKDARGGTLVWDGVNA